MCVYVLSVLYVCVDVLCVCVLSVLCMCVLSVCCACIV